MCKRYISLFPKHLPDPRLAEWDAELEDSKIDHTQVAIDKFNLEQKFKKKVKPTIHYWRYMSEKHSSCDEYSGRKIDFENAHIIGICTANNEDIFCEGDLNKCTHLPMVKKINDKLHSENKALKEDLDRERVRLAGCGVEALGYGKDKNGVEVKQGDWAYSASLGDVRVLRLKWEKLTQDRNRLREALKLLVVDIQAEINARQQYPNIGKKGCVERLEQALKLSGEE